MSPDLAFNTSVSFETNTNWQNYSGETGATYLTQAGVLAVRNFTSAATGLAIAIALFRGLTRRSVEDDRQLLGRPDPRRPVHPAADLGRRRPRPRLAGRPADVERARRPSRPSRARSRPSRCGPIASQEWIKELGNNGGGFLNANSAHPFESPTPLTNWLEMFAILLVPVRADLHVRPVRREPAPGLDDLRRDGARSCSSARSCAMHARVRRQPAVPGRRRPGRPRQHGGQGGPVRVPRSAACSWPSTTGTSTGAINSWHDSAQPIAGLVPLFNMELGEITPGRHRRRACTGCSSSARSSRCSSPA